MGSHQDQACSQLEDCMTLAPTVLVAKAPVKQEPPEVQQLLLPAFQKESFQGVVTRTQRPQWGANLADPCPSASRDARAPSLDPPGWVDHSPSLGLSCLICRMGVLTTALTPPRSE